MESKSQTCRKVAAKDLCGCDKCKTLKTRKWLIGKRTSLFSMCEQFRKAYLHDDQTSLEKFQTSFGQGHCICCGYTLLHLTVSVASKKLVSCYLSRNPELEARTDNGETALHLACVLNDPWFVEQLLISKVDVNAVDELGCTPLQICLSRDEPSTAILKMLLNHNARPNRLFIRGEDDEESIDKMVKANARNSSGVPPLYDATHNGDHSRTRSLLEDGACPNSLKCYRRTLLQVACFNKSVLCAKALLEAGADVNESDLEGRTALHYAVISNSRELVKLLTLHKCDFWARDSDGYTALEMAVLTNRLEVTNELFKRGARCDEALLLEALERRCTHAALSILCYSQFRVHDTEFGRALLRCAIATGQQKVVKYLQSMGVEGSYEGFDDEDFRLCQRESVPRKTKLSDRSIPSCVAVNRNVSKTKKRPYIPRLHSQAPRDRQCKQAKYPPSVDDSSESSLQSRRCDESDETMSAFRRFICSSDFITVTHEDVFIKTSSNNENMASSVETFFKFYELCVNY